MAGDTDYKNNIRTPNQTVDSVSLRVSELKELVQTKFEANAKIADERDRRYEDRFKSIDEKTSLAIFSSDKAVAKSDTATEKRFDSVNEFRETLKDQAAHLMPRAEADARFSGVEGKMDDIKKEIAVLRDYKSGDEGKEKAGEKHLATLISLLALALSIGALLLRGFGK